MRTRIDQWAAHNPTATGASLVTRPGTNPVPVVCSGIVCMAQHRRTCLTACGRHQRSSLVDVYALLTPRHYKCRRWSYPRRPRLSGGCSTCMEQSATRDSGLLLTSDIPEGDQVSPFSSVILWLTRLRLLRWSADACIELCNNFIYIL